MLENNNETIIRSLEYSITELKMKQSNYEKMLESKEITEDAKDVLRDLLMEVDYQIRDCEENIFESQEFKNKSAKKALEQSLAQLKIEHSIYDRALQNSELTEEENALFWGLLVGTEYEIRDCEKYISESLENKTNDQLYYHLNDSVKPVIRDQKDYQKAIRLEHQIVDAEYEYNYLQETNQFRTEKGKNVHARLVDLDKEQLAIIRTELAREYERVKRLTSLTYEKQILRKLNKQDRYLHLIESHEKTQDEIIYPKYPNNYARNLFYQFYLDIRLSKLRKKQGRLITQANNLINKDSKKAKTLRLINNVPQMQ